MDEKLLDAVKEAENMAVWDTHWRFDSLRTRLLEQELQADFERLFQEHLGLALPEVSIDYQGITINVPATSVKEAPKYLRAVKFRGWERAKQTEPEVVGSSHRWKHTKSGEPKALFLVLDYSRASGENACKLVQTGTKTVEHPVYELVCPDNSMHTPNG